jgi:hypothetical protein
MLRACYILLQMCCAREHDALSWSMSVLTWKWCPCGSANVFAEAWLTLSDRVWRKQLPPPALPQFPHQWTQFPLVLSCNIIGSQGGDYKDHSCPRVDRYKTAKVSCESLAFICKVASNEKSRFLRNVCNFFLFRYVLNVFQNVLFFLCQYMLIPRDVV